MKNRIYIDPKLKSDPKYIDKLKDAITLFSWQHDGPMEPSDYWCSKYAIIHESSVDAEDNMWSRTESDRYYVIFDDMYSSPLFLSTLRDCNPIWSRFSDHGYEVTSKGDKRFSPFYMYKYYPLPDKGDYISLEDYYQLILKGYWNEGYRRGLDAKYKPPLDSTNFSEKTYQMYEDYLKSHEGLLFELMYISKTKVLTDMFDVNGGQNKIYVDIINSLKTEFYGDLSETVSQG